MDDHPSQQQDVTITAENRKVLDFIESCFNGILQQIKVRPYGKPVIALKRIVAVKPSYDETDSTRLKWNIQDREVRYSFPGKNKDEAWRFGGRLKKPFPSFPTPQAKSKDFSCVPLTQVSFFKLVSGES